jgi:4-hydroxybenzoate polyprenyltransferase
MRALLEAMRPYQWVKNLLVFAPLIFAQRLFDTPELLRATLAFVAFCLVSSGIYLLNDLRDIENDRNHPKKCRRALASGRLSSNVAWVAFFVLEVVGLGIAWWDGFLWVPAVYLVINLLYTYHLKHIVILDAMCIAIGFLLRVHAGGAAIGVPVSSWLTLCTFFVALLLAFCKRRHEILILGEDGKSHRVALEDYSLSFLDQMIAVLGGLTVMCYALYTVAPETQKNLHTGDLVYTVPFVTYGIFRYLFLVHQRAEGGDPTRLLLKDKLTVLNIVLWFLVSCYILYHKSWGI